VKRRPCPAPFAGKLLVVGGQCRKVGKTALCVDLIRLMGDLPWTVVKITPHTESSCPVGGVTCGCPQWEHTFSIREESSRSAGKDTCRYLQAGAKTAFWVQTKAGCLANALAALKGVLEGARCVLIESDAVARFWQPDMFLMVLDPRRADFKPSARVQLVSADLLLLRAPIATGVPDVPVLDRLVETPHFLQPFGYPIPSYMQKLVRQHFHS
jgi:hypothetical protein